MTDPHQLSDHELAEAATRARARHELTARTSDGFFLSDGRRRSAATALAASADALESLAREWVLRSVERLVGTPVSRVEVRREDAGSPAAVVAAVAAVAAGVPDGEDAPGPELVAGVADVCDPDLTAALSCLSAAWAAPVPTNRVLTRREPAQA